MEKKLYCKTIHFSLFPYASLDINECLTTCNNSLTQRCIDTQGNYICQCKAGFVAIGNDICENINECLANNGGCDSNALCTDTVGSFKCSCNSGFYGDGFDCQGTPIYFIVILNFNYSVLLSNREEEVWRRHGIIII